MQLRTADPPEGIAVNPTVAENRRTMPAYLCRTFTGLVAAAMALGLAGCDPRNQTTTGTPVHQGIDTTAPPASNSTEAKNGTELPPMKHFRIGGDVYGPMQDCRVVNDAVTCILSWNDPQGAVDSYSGTATGTPSGTTMKGTSKTHQTGHDETDPSRLWQEEVDGQFTYVFSTDGTVATRSGPEQWRMTHSGSCSGSESGTSSVAEGNANWTVIE